MSSSSSLWIGDFLSVIAILLAGNEFWWTGAVPVDQHGLCERRPWDFAIGDADGDQGAAGERIAGRDLCRTERRKKRMFGHGTLGRKSRNLIAKPEERAQFGKGRALRRCERDGSSHTGVDETDRTVRSIAQARRSRRGTTYDDDGRKTTEKNVTLTLFLAVEIEIEIPIGVKFHYLSVKTLHNTVCFIKP